MSRGYFNWMHRLSCAAGCVKVARFEIDRVSIKRSQHNNNYADAGQTVLMPAADNTIVREYVFTRIYSIYSNETNLFTFNFGGISNVSFELSYRYRRLRVWNSYAAAYTRISRRLQWRKSIQEISRFRVTLFDFDGDKAYQYNTIFFLWLEATIFFLSKFWGVSELI